MKDQNEWFHKDEVAEMLEDFVIRVLEQIGDEPDNGTLINEIYLEASCKYEHITDCEDFMNIIRSFANHAVNFAVGCSDHIERNEAYLE